MKISFNNNFEILTGYEFELDKIKFCDASEFVRTEEIVISEDCYYYKKFAIAGYSKSLTDRTGSEAFYNKLRVDDLIKRKMKPIQVFECGLSVAKELAYRLEVLFQTGFIVNLSYNYQHCYVRFYKIRIGENYTADDLNSYRNEAILLIQI